MTCFNGILNDNGINKRIHLFLDLQADSPYFTDIYMNNKKNSALIIPVPQAASTLDLSRDLHLPSSIFIDGTEYQYYMEIFKDEIIIAGREIINLFHMLFPCFYKQNFFVVSNKERV